MSDSSNDAYLASELWISCRGELQEKINENAKNGVWETSDGQKIKFSDLDDSHKRNIIKMGKYWGLNLPDFFYED